MLVKKGYWNRCFFSAEKCCRTLTRARRLINQPWRTRRCKMKIAWVLSLESFWKMDMFINQFSPPFTIISFHWSKYRTSRWRHLPQSHQLNLPVGDPTYGSRPRPPTFPTNLEAHDPQRVQFGSTVGVDSVGGEKGSNPLADWFFGSILGYHDFSTNFQEGSSFLFFWHTVLFFFWGGWRVFLCLVSEIPPVCFCVNFAGLHEQHDHLQWSESQLIASKPVRKEDGTMVINTCSVKKQEEQFSNNQIGKPVWIPNRILENHWLDELSLGNAMIKVGLRLQGSAGKPNDP